MYPGSQPWLQAPSALSQELSPPQVALQLSEQSASYLPASHSGKRSEKKNKKTFVNKEPSRKKVNTLSDLPCSKYKLQGA